ncbi:unnamed protein product [Ilex paraguariensis]|uniref:Uncharacterized protein n=1 Tax=Ilex paraguariensis TaxID=185542 RepID=A0ABC8QQ64_9AQUA
MKEVALKIADSFQKYEAVEIWATIDGGLKFFRMELSKEESITTPISSVLLVSKFTLANQSEYGSDWNVHLDSDLASVVQIDKAAYIKPIDQIHSYLDESIHRGPAILDLDVKEADFLFEVGVIVESNPSLAGSCFQKSSLNETQSPFSNFHRCPNQSTEVESNIVPRRRFSRVEKGKSIRDYKPTPRDPNWSIQEAICGEKRSYKGKGDAGIQRKWDSFEQVLSIRIRTA